MLAGVAGGRVGFFLELARSRPAAKLWIDTIILPSRSKTIEPILDLF
jgi:hypothetical protein